MIEPPPARRVAGTAYFTYRNTPSRFTAVWRRQSARVISTALHMIPIPAFATITSRRPIDCRSVASITPEPALFVGYVLMQKDRRAAAAADLVNHQVTARSIEATTMAPSRASVTAQAAPIPDAPPVTIATLF